MLSFGGRVIKNILIDSWHLNRGRLKGIKELIHVDIWGIACQKKGNSQRPYGGTMTGVFKKHKEATRQEWNNWEEEM